MSELHAAVGLVHLERLDQFIAVRRRVAAFYDEALTTQPGITPLVEPEGCISNIYKYIALLDPDVSRDRVKERLRDEHGVTLSGEVYARPLHTEPVFAGLADGSFPVADDVCARHVCLPVHSDMSDAEAEHVIESLAEVLRSLQRVGAAGREAAV